uniref:Uncharacterized protein n=1 Tax=Glossina austeni TaxID=7395 RepID=A0A1A9VIZ5_GLOAU
MSKYIVVICVQFLVLASGDSSITNGFPREKIPVKSLNSLPDFFKFQQRLSFRNASTTASPSIDVATTAKTFPENSTKKKKSSDFQQMSNLKELKQIMGFGSSEETFDCLKKFITNEERQSLMASILNSRKISNVVKHKEMWDKGFGKDFKTMGYRTDPNVSKERRARENSIQTNTRNLSENSEVSKKILQRLKSDGRLKKCIAANAMTAKRKATVTPPTTTNVCLPHFLYSTCKRRIASKGKKEMEDLLMSRRKHLKMIKKLSPMAYTQNSLVEVQIKSALRKAMEEDKGLKIFLDNENLI